MSWTWSPRTCRTSPRSRMPCCVSCVTCRGASSSTAPRDMRSRYPTPTAARWPSSGSPRCARRGPGGTSLEGKFLHAKAAGNDASVHAALASDLAGAMLFPNLTDATGAPVPTLTNALDRRERRRHQRRAVRAGLSRKCRRTSPARLLPVGTAVFSSATPASRPATRRGRPWRRPRWRRWRCISGPWPRADATGRHGSPPGTARPGVAQSVPRCSTFAVATAPAIDAYAAVSRPTRGWRAPRVRRTLLDVANTAGAATPDGRSTSTTSSAILD